jgi:hypothetical protein
MVKRWIVYYLWWTSACFKNISITFDLRLLIIHSASSNFSKCYQIKEFNSQAPLESHILWFQYCSFFWQSQRSNFKRAMMYDVNDLSKPFMTLKQTRWSQKIFLRNKYENVLIPASSCAIKVSSTLPNSIL